MSTSNEITGTNANDYLNGTNQSDSILAYNGDDIINGLAGNDIINGGFGNNRYLFGRGDGQDKLLSYQDSRDYFGNDTGKFNIIQFKPGISASDINAYRDPNNTDYLVLEIKDTTDSIRISNFFNNNRPLDSYNPIQHILFDDGTEWDIETIIDKAFVGDETSENMYGTTGEYSDNTFNGMAGNDVIKGMAGNNTYLFGRGDGQDTIASYQDSRDYLGDETGKYNTIQFKPGISASDINAYRDPNDTDYLVLEIKDTTDSIRINNFFNNNKPLDSYNPIQHITFDDGTEWDLGTIIDKAFVGNETSENMYGTTGVYADNTFNGMAGNDVIKGMAGNNTYLFGRGDGQDTISSYQDSRDYLGNDSGKLNVLKFKDGINESDIQILRDNTTLVVNVNNEDSVSIRSFFSSSNSSDTSFSTYQPVQHIEFNDGTVWSLDEIVDRINQPYNPPQQTFTGTYGDDLLVGSNFGDYLYGRTGNDLYYINHSSDIITETANGGVDTALTTVNYSLDANVENLTITSDMTLYGIGNDLDNTIQGNNSSNTLKGEAGDDVLYGNKGDDLLVGGQGNDVLNGGDGFDTVSYWSSDSMVTVDLANKNAQDTLGAGLDTFISIEKLYGSRYNDKLRADENGSYLDGSHGDDLLFARGGNDTLNGGSGTDGASYWYASQGVSIDLNKTGVQNTQGSGLDILTNIEKLYGSKFNDKLRADEDGSYLNGSRGDDLLYARGGNDILIGGSGVDSVSYWYASNGVLIDLEKNGAQNTQGAGTDTFYSIENLYGSKYDDNLKADQDGSYLNGADGDDLLYSRTGNDIMIGGSGTDIVSYWFSDSSINVNLSISATQNTGGAGADRLIGIESLYGSRFDDTFEGNNAQNYLYGSSGDDVLNGGLGSDRLKGGSGSDTFVFEDSLSIDNIDTITDFVSTSDVISLNQSIFDSIGSKLDYWEIKSNAQGEATDSTDYIVYNTSTGELSYDSDGNGVSEAQVFAVLANVESITYQDFVVV